MLLMAVFTVWAHTSWSATIITADWPGTLWMVLAVMLLGLFMNAALPGAFEGSAWAFVAPLVAINLARTAWTIVSARATGLDLYREHYVRVLVWFVGIAPLWVAGALAGPEARLPWWAVAAGIEVVGTWLGNPVPGRRLVTTHVPFDADHILEGSVANSNRGRAGVCGRPLADQVRSEARCTRLTSPATPGRVRKREP